MESQNQSIAFHRELRAACTAEADVKLSEARRCLELAHVIGQTRLLYHWQTHQAMLALALRTRQPQEALAQIVRLLLTPLGHLTGRLPQFNPGSGRVGAFEPMAWPPELDPATLERRR